MINCAREEENRPPTRTRAERLLGRELNPSAERWATRSSVIATPSTPLYALLRPLNIDNANMHNFLESFTRKGRKVKERLRGKKGKRDKSGGDTTDESISSSSSFLRPVPHIAAGGHDGEGSRVSTDTRQVHSRGRSPQPEPVPAGGRCDDGKGKGVDIGKKVASRDHSFLGPNVEIVVGGGPSPTEVGPLVPSPPTPILHSGEPESTWACSLYLLYLIVPSDNTEPSAALDKVPEVVLPDESTERSPTASEGKFDWGSTAAATAKLLLRGVRDTADAFGPLKSVAGGLCFILENYEVRLAPW